MNLKWGLLGDLSVLGGPWYFLTSYDCTYIPESRKPLNCTPKPHLSCPITAQTLLPHTPSKNIKTLHTTAQEGAEAP